MNIIRAITPITYELILLSQKSKYLGLLELCFLKENKPVSISFLSEEMQ